MIKIKAVIFGDCHCPFQDDAAVDSVLKYIRKTKPEIVIINGDFLDCYKISNFCSDPGARSLKKELQAGRELLQRVYRSIPNNAKIVWMDGNHEVRLQRYVWGRAPELNGILTVPELMRLEDYGIEYLEYGDPFLLEGILIKHGHRFSSVSGGYTVKREMDKEDGSVIMGHTHNLAQIFRTYRERTIFGIETGHLADMSKIEYLRSKGGFGDWQSGFCSLIETRHGLRAHIHEVINGEVV